MLRWRAQGDDEDAVKEQERSQRLEDNYRFKWNRNNENEQRWSDIALIALSYWRVLGVQIKASKVMNNTVFCDSG